jgi:hypothetical protein
MSVATESPSLCSSFWTLRVFQRLRVSRNAADGCEAQGAAEGPSPSTRGGPPAFNGHTHATEGKSYHCFDELSGERHGAR